MFKDTLHNIKRVVALPPATRTADANGADCDRSGYHAVGVSVNVGNSGDVLAPALNISLELQHANDNGSGAAGTYEPVPEEQMLGAVSGTLVGQFALIDAPAEDSAVFACAYLGGRKWVRVVYNITGTHTNGTPVAAQYDLATPMHAPVA